MRRIGLVMLAAYAVIGGNGLGLASAGAADSEPTRQADFCADVWPVIQQKCLRCHNPKRKEGALDMSTRAAMLRGGHSGPAFVPGKVEKSLMLELIEFDEMPPRKEKPRIAKDELDKLRAWIAAGAPVPEEDRPSDCRALDPSPPARPVVHAD